MQAPEKAKIRIRSINTLWQEWLYSYGAITMCIVLSFVIPKFFLPLAVLLMSWLLSRYVMPWRGSHKLQCVRVTSLTSRVLLFTALIMVGCIACAHYAPLRHFFYGEDLNPKSPYVTALIIFPVSTVVMAYGLFTHSQARSCVECKLRLGMSPEDDLTDNIFHREARFQLRLLFVIGLALSVVNWAYYFLNYRNVNMNGVDKYFFLVVPVILFIISLFYIGRRYHEAIANIDAIYRSGSKTHTELRFLVLHGDLMLLDSIGDPETGTLEIDTPYSQSIKHTESVSTEQARTAFAKLTGITDFTLRPLYNNVTRDLRSNVFHFAVVLPEEMDVAKMGIKGEWNTIDEVNRLWKYQVLSTSLAAEVNRIVTITMAWKTYDRNGYRIYPMKHYQPNFRLSDFKNWDVDYSDLSWIEVAANNQDRPLFHVRRFMKRILGKS